MFPPLALLLAPGAGASRDHPCLVAIEQAVGPTGVVVARMDFPYRKAGRRAPDREPVLVAAVRAEAEALVASAGVEPSMLVAGGRSLGGRMCSLAVAQGMPSVGLCLVSYPLHPPGRPDKLRTAHFGQLDVPCLFVSGTADAFASPGELEAATSAIPGLVTHVWIDRGDHGLRGRDAQVAAAVSTWLPVVTGGPGPRG